MSGGLTLLEEAMLHNHSRLRHVHGLTPLRNAVLTWGVADAVEVNGKTLALGHSEVTASGLTVTYANATVEDGSLWVHPGPFMLPSVTMTTER